MSAIYPWQTQKKQRSLFPSNFSIFSFVVVVVYVVWFDIRKHTYIYIYIYTYSIFFLLLVRLIHAIIFIRRLRTYTQQRISFVFLSLLFSIHDLLLWWRNKFCLFFSSLCFLLTMSISTRINPQLFRFLLFSWFVKPCCTCFSFLVGVWTEMILFTHFCAY